MEGVVLSCWRSSWGSEGVPGRTTPRSRSGDERLNGDLGEPGSA